MSKRKDIIRVGDLVKIINPVIFDRCGYPLTKEIVLDTLITEKQKQSVASLIQAFEIKTSMQDLNDNEYLEAYDKVLYLMSGYILKQKRWGGSERQIFSTGFPEIKNVICRVINRKVVKTGKYEPGYSHCSYDGEYDYEPSYLSNEETHVIFTVHTHENLNSKVYYGQEFKIEKCNVKKVENLEVELNRDLL